MVSDAWAQRIGRLTLPTLLGLVLLRLLAGLFGTELPWLFERRAFWGVLGVVALTAYATACVTMVLHQGQSGSLSETDRAEWDARQQTKLGLLVPFTYLLASPKERRTLGYLGQSRPTKKPLRWY